jgi:hypothetical protein
MDAENGLVVTVDRVERDERGEPLAVLVLDDGQQLVVPLRWLPDGTRAGSIFRLHFDPDPATEQERRDAIRRLQQRLFGLEPGEQPD